jgi:hypothetical protein
VTETFLEPDSLVLAGKSPNLTFSLFQGLNTFRPTPESTDIGDARNPAITAVKDGNAIAAVGDCIKVAFEPVNQLLQASLEVHGDGPPLQPSDEPQRSAPENDNSPQSEPSRNHDRRPRRTRRKVYGSVAIRRSTRIQTILQQAVSTSLSSAIADANFLPEDYYNQAHVIFCIVQGWTEEDIIPKIKTADQADYDNIMELIIYYAVFAIATIGYYKTDHIRRLSRNYSDIYRHPMKQQFLNACRKELITLISMGIWRLVNKKSANITPFPLKWVFTYKLDENNNIVRCKARICVKGDLQNDPGGDTYAATLTARFFRTIMAKAAFEDFEC